MTEIVENAGTAAPVNPVVNSSPPPSTAQEKSFRQEEVNDIVKRAKHDAVETYRRLQVEQPEYVQKKYGDIPSVQAPTINPDDIKKLAAEEIQKVFKEQSEYQQRQAQEAEAQRIAGEFFGKLQQGKEKYQDFDNVAGDVDYQRFPNLVRLVTGYSDNIPDIMYELGKDRAKMANLEALAYISPNDAIKQMQMFAASVKKNAEAKNFQHPNAPLSQLKPSHTGMDDGVATVKSLRMKYKG